MKNTFRSSANSLVAVFIAIAAVAEGWHVTFTPAIDNDHVQMDTLCYENNTLVYQAVDDFPITPGSGGMVVRRHITPSKALCNIAVYLFKKGADSASETAGITE